MVPEHRLCLASPCPTIAPGTESFSTEKSCAWTHCRTMAKTRTVVIVGGSFAGVSTALRILKQASKVSTDPFRIILVSRDSQFYWNIAIPSAIIPQQLSDDQVFQPIEKGFSSYSPSQFEFVLGTATGISIDTKELDITPASGGQRKIPYDFLILGTGSFSKESNH